MEVKCWHCPNRFLYVHKDSIMLSKQIMFFSPIELKLFFWTFQTSWTMKWPVTYMSVIVIYWPFCVCNASCVIISISKYLPINTKFGTNMPQCNTSGRFLFFEFSISVVFIDFFSFLGLIQFFRWNPDRFSIEFLWFLWGKWTILRLFY